jgi:hypothetical protein
VAHNGLPDNTNGVDCPGFGLVRTWRAQRGDAQRWRDYLPGGFKGRADVARRKDGVCSQLLASGGFAFGDLVS